MVLFSYLFISSSSSSPALSASHFGCNHPHNKVFRKPWNQTLLHVPDPWYHPFKTLSPPCPSSQPAVLASNPAPPPKKNSPVWPNNLFKIITTSTYSSPPTLHTPHSRERSAALTPSLQPTLEPLHLQRTPAAAHLPPPQPSEARGEEGLFYARVTPEEPCTSRPALASPRDPLVSLHKEPDSGKHPPSSGSWRFHAERGPCSHEACFPLHPWRGSQVALLNIIPARRYMSWIVLNNRRAEELLVISLWHAHNRPARKKEPRTQVHCYRAAVIQCEPPGARARCPRVMLWPPARPHSLRCTSAGAGS